MLGDAGNARASVWISYGFIHFTYFMLLLTPYFVRRGSAEYMYRRPPYLVTTTWFLTTFVIGVTFILIDPETVKATIVVQVILSALFLGWLLILLIANEHTADNVERREAELQYVKQSSSQLNTILQQITDKPTVKKVEKIYDLIYSSPSRSNANVHSLEQEVISEIERLASVVNQNDMEQIVSIADKIYRLADERNRQLKISHK